MDKESRSQYIQGEDLVGATGALEVVIPDFRLEHPWKAQGNPAC